MSPGAHSPVSSAIASGEGLKYRFTFSGLLCRDLAMSISRLALASPRWVRPECRHSCRSQPLPASRRRRSAADDRASSVGRLQTASAASDPLATHQG